MAKFIAWGDLHDEFWNQVPVIPEAVMDADAILLAGDVSTRGRHVDVAWEVWKQIEKPVLMVRGNHEFYGGIIPEIVKQDTERLREMAALGADIRMLDGGTTIVAGTRIIGVTLWTDLDLYPGMARDCRQAVYQGMNDFSKIRVDPTRHLEIDDWLEMHWRDRECFLKELAKPFDGKTVVMTHHIPVRDMIHPLREIGAPARYVSNAGFASDLWHQIREHDISVWLSGHSHDNRSAMKRGDHGDIRFLSNSRGYPREGAAFDPGFVFEV